MAETLLSAVDDRREWVDLRIDSPVGSDWYSPADLTDPHHPILSELLTEACADEGRPRQVAARAVFTALATCLLTPQVLTLARQRRLPVLAASEVKVRRTSGWPAEVAWNPSGMIVLSGDPMRGEPDTVVSDSLGELYRHLVEWAWVTFEPVLDAITARMRVGRVGMWGAVVDCFAQVGPQVDDRDPRPPCAELELFRAAAQGTPLAHDIPVIQVNRPDSDRFQVGRSTCCLFYREPVDPGVDMPPWLQGPWERYCTACPLLPTEETLRRLNRRVSQLEEERT